MVEDIKFRSCSILRSASKGTGAYGSVYKARCDNLLCAAKILHPTLVFSTDEGQVPPERLHTLPRVRFESECRFLSAIRHPNIVQYLGMSVDPVTNLPVLLMELMDTNLTGFLECADQPLPFHTQVNMCHDIALALSFLHSNSIIHRDLSSNNVLMIADRRAKVADFGMARLFARGDSKLTENPGTEFYMPPEALGDDPRYEAGMDCFSFGVLTVQILTLVYPKPASKYVPIEGGKDLHKRVTEVQRRQSHIELVEPAHPLLLLALECLREEEGTRPSAQQLCLRVEKMQELAEFSESEKACDLLSENRALREQMKRMKQEYEEEITSLKSRHSEIVKNIEEQRLKELTELQKAHTQRMGELHEAHLRQIGDLHQVIKTVQEDMKFIQHNHNHDIMRLKQEHALYLKSVEEEREELRQRYKEKDGEVKRWKREKDLEDGATKMTKPDSSDKKNELIINWKQMQRQAPQPLYREDSEAVYCNDTLYLRPASRRTVLAYNPQLDSWMEMPKCPHKHSTLAHMQRTVLAIGGITDSLAHLNKIYYLTDEGGKCRWEEAEFCMPTKRCSAMAVTAGTSLVIAGGDGEEARLRKVEVMNTETHTWSTAANLPEALVFSSTTFCNGHLYFLGGEVGYNGVEKNLMLTCSLENLLKTCTKSSQKQRLVDTPINIWNKVIGPPVTRSTCVSFQGRVLSVGGKGEDKKPTSAVYQYCAGVWRVVSYMSVTRSKCFAAAVVGDRILVVGGNTYSGKTDSLEVGTLLSHRTRYYSSNSE